MMFYRAIFIALTAMFGSMNLAFAAEDFVGEWTDNLVGLNRVGLLTISKDRITVGGKSKITFHVKPLGPFGDGELFEVTGMKLQGHKSPLPCDNAHFIVVQRFKLLPPVSFLNIHLVVDEGTSAPTVESIKESVKICADHPFARRVKR